MLPQILALTISGGPEGGKIDIGTWPFILGTMPFIMIIFMCAFGITFAIIKKHFEHKQILAAIEKGTPLSELIPVKRTGPNWIRSLTGGIALLLISIGMAIIASASIIFDYPDRDAGFGLFIASVVFLALGTASTIRGILLRKYDKASAFNANNGH